MDSALSAHRLVKSYRGKRALDGCEFAVPEGAVTALVGPNGAGKSTLLALAAGLLKPSSGELRVFGERPTGRTHPQVGYLAQNRPLYGRLTVAETLRLGRAFNQRWAQRRAVQVLDQAEVPLDARVHTLSEGARTQVGIALALGREPDLLLLDEPLSALDPLARDETLRLLMGEVADRGMTLVMSSHLLSDLHDVCDHLVLLIGGAVRLTGPIEDLLAEHRVLVGPASRAASVDGVVQASSTERQATLLVRGESVPEGWAGEQPTLEALVLGYLRAARAR
ncbi:ABC transporter ATP-binding protein [Kutzneria viridogrisea]|uniref:ABC-2 type transport system ATP-binding protein n=1 Tax=Kutzneria viridogrisea TaxID=47990 RepID=A0ABR6BNN5_9PSEU|nr:ABC-2 type transport system ATP-binding protein [Kutzneria viridogrisea]